jgi:hypothetical protein
MLACPLVLEKDDFALPLPFDALPGPTAAPLLPRALSIATDLDPPAKQDESSPKSVKAVEAPPTFRRLKCVCLLFETNFYFIFSSPSPFYNVYLLILSIPFGWFWLNACNQICRSILPVVSTPDLYPAFGARMMDNMQGKGIIVMSVNLDSLAAKSSLEIGDIILRFDGHAVDSVLRFNERLLGTNFENTFNIPTQVIMCQFFMVIFLEVLSCR